MSSIKLDQATGDVVLENNSIVLTQDRDAIRQHLQVRLRLFRNEWFLDTRLGVPYFEDILKKNPSLTVVDAIMKQTILDTPGITDIQAFEFDFNSPSRKLNISGIFGSTEGVIDFTQEIDV